MKEKKTVLITGGAKRIGAALALHFSEKGYSVALHYNNSEDHAREVAAKIIERGGECRIYRENLLNLSHTLVERVLKDFPHLCLLINNASLFEHDSLRECDEDLWDRLWKVNFKAPFFLTREFALGVKKGAVLNITDCKVAGNDPEHFTYLLSKKALQEFTFLAARELAPYIRVNAIAPGHILKANSTTITSPDIRSVNTIITEEKPGIMGILGAADYLTVNESVTGQCLYVDGGQNLF